MGREIRRVPPNYEHPKNEKGYIPLYEKSYKEAAEEWLKGFKEFEPDDDFEYYWEYEGNPPNEELHVKYEEKEATWYQIYETVSEGTPVTPPFETKEELVKYLCEHGDFWDQKRGDGPWQKENAEKFCENGFSFSGIIYPGKREIKRPRDGI